MKTKDTSRGFQIPKFGTSGWQIRWNGCIGSEANRNNIINNHDIIGREIATGVFQYLNNGKKPGTTYYKCIYK